VVGALAEHPEEIARRWLIALLEARPLAEAATVPLADFARAAPGLCATVLDAVRSDEALDRLGAPAAALDRPAGEAAAGNPVSGEVPDRPAGEAAAEVLAAVAGSREGPAVVRAAEALRRAACEAAADELPRSDAEVLAAFTDRVAHICAQVAAAAMGQAAPAAEPAVPPLAGEPFQASRVEPDAAPLWLGALERQLAEGGRFGLLLVELDGADRLRLSEGDDAARDLFARTGRAVRGAVRRCDLLAHEEDGRMWVIAPDAGRTGAEALAARIAAAVEGAATVRGVPLTVSVGLALFPHDGRDVPSLTAQAEESGLAARAAGVRFTSEAADEPAAPGPRLVP
jgi:GGDEF domain-containing protein